VNVENPAALRFIMQDDIYLLPADKIASPKKTEAPVVQTPQPVFNYLGKNKKNLLITVHYTDSEFIADEHLTALENILKRKEHLIDDVAILNLATQTITDIAQLEAYFKPVKILILGAQAMPKNLEALAVNQLKQLGDYTALYSFSFAEMMSSTDNKKAFWDQMKNL
jgi:hypothetical protein